MLSSSGSWSRALPVRATSAARIEVSPAVLSPMGSPRDGSALARAVRSGLARGDTNAIDHVHDTAGGLGDHGSAVTLLAVVDGPGEEDLPLVDDDVDLGGVDPRVVGEPRAEIVGDPLV